MASSDGVSPAIVVTQATPYSAFSAGLPCPAAPLLSSVEVHLEAVTILAWEGPRTRRRTKQKDDGGILMCEAWFIAKATGSPSAASEAAIAIFDDLLHDPQLADADKQDVMYWRALAMLFRDRATGLDALVGFAKEFPDGRWAGDAWVWVGDVEACGCGCIDLPSAPD